MLLARAPIADGGAAQTRPAAEEPVATVYAVPAQESMPRHATVVGTAPAPAQRVVIMAASPAYGTSATTTLTVLSSSVGHWPRHRSVRVACASCHNVVDSHVRHEAGCGTVAACASLASVGCFMGCCLLPFAMDDCKDTEHLCPQCGADLGRNPLLC